MNYITYADKEASLELNSVYIMTAGDANEIKLVVNSVVDWLKREGATVRKMFRYVKVEVPELDGAADLTLEASADRGFSRDVSRLTLSESPEKFMAFSDGRFRRISRLFREGDSGMTVLADISDMIGEERAYCRYQFTGHRMRAFVLGANDCQPWRTEEPAPIILIGDSELSGQLDTIRDCGKEEAIIASNRMTETGPVSAQDCHVFLKYSRIPANVLQFCEGRPGFTTVGPTLIDATGAATVSVLPKGPGESRRVAHGGPLRRHCGRGEDGVRQAESS